MRDYDTNTPPPLAGVETGDSFLDLRLATEAEINSATAIMQRPDNRLDNTTVEEDSDLEYSLLLEAADYPILEEATADNDQLRETPNRPTSKFNLDGSLLESPFTLFAGEVTTKNTEEKPKNPPAFKKLF